MADNTTLFGQKWKTEPRKSALGVSTIPSFGLTPLPDIVQPTPAAPVIGPPQTWGGVNPAGLDKMFADMAAESKTPAYKQQVAELSGAAPKSVSAINSPEFQGKLIAEINKEFTRANNAAPVVTTVSPESNGVNPSYLNKGANSLTYYGGIGDKPFDPDPTGRIQRERDSAYANNMQTKNDIQNDIDKIMYERKIDEATNWAGRGLGIGQYVSKYGADVLPELMKLKEGANLNASKSAMESINKQVEGEYGLEGQKTVGAAHVEAARLAADANRGVHTANRDLEERKFKFEIAKFAETNDLKNPVNYLKLAASIAPKKTSFDESGAPTVEPDVNAGLTVLESLGYPAPAGIKSKKPPTPIERAKQVLAEGADRDKVVKLLKTKGFTDEQLKVLLP